MCLLSTSLRNHETPLDLRILRQSDERRSSHGILKVLEITFEAEIRGHDLPGFETRCG